MRRMMLENLEGGGDMAEWTEIKTINVDTNTKKNFVVNFDKEYDEIKILFTIPVCSENSENKTFAIWLNDSGSPNFGHVNWLTFKSGMIIVADISTKPFVECKMYKNDINISWFLQSNDINFKYRKEVNVDKIRKIKIGSEKEDFIFKSGTKLTVYGR